jgi:predicted nucleic acid-binding protein
MSADFLDTNILVYAALAEDAGDRRPAIAKALVERGAIVSVQVLNEFAQVARRKLNRSWPEITSALAAFRKFLEEPRALTIATHEAALKIAERDGFSFYDCLIIASAVEAGCSTLLSEDMQNGRVVDGRLTIRNPFTAR